MNSSGEGSRSPRRITDLEGCLGLHLIPRLGPVRGQRLLAQFGTVQAIVTAPLAGLQQVEGIDSELAAAITAVPERTNQIQQELAQLKTLGGRCLSWTDDHYPEGLRPLADPPLVLYLRGTITTDDVPAVALVGTRRPTPYGLKIAAQLAAALAERGITTISGLARGIDGAVHRGSLQKGGRTIAVLGHGLDHCYPPEHRALAEEIVQRGALVTELPLGIGVDRSHFPRRNRIIAGLSLGVVVVEADLRSG
ncbi:MAG: DNA-protecting protein DprA, partial [Elusimicrobia bacterium]|nr:DNA-protecting protein DprA [Elusimicrobiota bacterium]